MSAGQASYDNHLGAAGAWFLLGQYCHLTTSISLYTSQQSSGRPPLISYHVNTTLPLWSKQRRTRRTVTQPGHPQLMRARTKM